MSRTNDAHCDTTTYDSIPFITIQYDPYRSLIFQMNTFTKAMGWTLLRKQWAGHFYDRDGVDTFTKVMGWTLLRKRWGGHFYGYDG